MKLQRKALARAIAQVCGCALLASLSTPVLAQKGILEEVIVTAQKREESLQDVGIAITAFSGEQLEAFGFSQSTDIASFTPGIHISGNNGGSTQQFTIRGATQNDFADIAEGPNAVYVDEAYMATGQSQLFASFDVERVEMLKGPQGTLFGRNATGGLVHYVTRKPTEEKEGFVDVQYGDYNMVRTEAAISGPIANNLLGRASVLYRRHDTLMDNNFTPADLPPIPAAFPRPSIQGSPAGQDDIWKDDNIAARGQLLFNVSDDAEVLLKGQYGKQQLTSGQYQHESTTAVLNAAGQTVESVFTKRQPGSAQTCETLLNTGGCGPDIGFDLDFDGTRPVAGGDLFGYVEPDTRDLDVNTDHTTDGYDEVESYGFTGKVDWDLGWASLIAVGAYHHLDKRQSLDVDSGPAPQFIVMNQSESEWFSAEVRLEGEADRFRWIAGFYFLDIGIDYAQGLADSIGGLNVFSSFFGGFTGAFGNPRGPADSIETTLNAELDTTSYSIFGQIDYDLTEQWALSFGLRAIREEKDYTYRVDFYDNIDDRRPDSILFGGATPLAPNAALFPSLPNQQYRDDFADTLWSGRIGLNWTPTEDLLMYASVSRGVKAASYNAPLLTDLTPEQMRYDEEVLVSYEAGFKTSLFNGLARVNGAFFYYDYKDYQAFQFIGTSGAVFNADAEYYGMELELQANPIDNMDFIFGLALLDATVQDLAISGPVGGAAAVRRDVQPTFTPQVQLSGILRYTWPAIVAGGDVTFQADANYASNAFHNINNFKSHKMPAYVVGNLRLNWFSADDHWELGAFVNNVGDERYQTIGFELSGVSGSNEETIGAPRWWGISARYNWF